MPIPAIIAGVAAIGATALGIGAQADAKETNELAQKIADEARSKYDKASASLQSAKGRTERSLINLGNSKKNVLDTTMRQFLGTFEKIKNIQLSESVGLNEIKNFSLQKQDALELRKMEDIYSNTVSTGAAGTAAGVAIALAANGTLPIVTGTLSIAGSALAVGEVGVAAELAGSALSLGAAMTPLAAIAAPAVLFTGISASMKADENYEKANTMQAEANAAIEKMKTSEVLCNAITDRSDMFDNLLNELNGMFSYCSGMLDVVVRQKTGMLKGKTVDASTFTEDELKLVMVTRSLAGAVKAVIDVPILTSDGDINPDAKVKYENTMKELPAFRSAVNEVEHIDYTQKARVTTVKHSSECKNNSTSSLRNSLAFIAGIIVACAAHFMINYDLATCIMIFTVTTLIVMDNNMTNGAYAGLRDLLCTVFVSCFTRYFFISCNDIVAREHYIIMAIIVFVVGFVIFGVSLPGKNKKISSIRYMVVRVASSVTLFALAVLIYAFLFKFLKIPHIVSAIVVSAAYALFAWAFCLAENPGTEKKDQ